ncbi:MAG: extracellular solute-binding protein [Hamadaea sp.]|nr:extracellular solute-binding protein [Hamadaea sp.]NUT18971.1 extracellular solute-binding protein [Hamadaea sp.]
MLRGIGAAALAGGTVGGAAALAGCAPSASTNQQPLGTPSFSAPPAGEVTIWDRSGDLYKVFDKAIASFTAKYPQVKVNHLAVDINAKLPSTLISGAEVPDGAFYDDALIPGIAPQLFDLSTLIEPYKKDIAPYKLGVVTVEGRVVAVPWDLDPGLLFYRADLVEQAGVDPAKIATYDDLLAAARTVKGKFPASKPLHLEANEYLSQLWLDMFVNQQGAAIVDSAGKLAVDTTPYRTALTWLDKVRAEDLGTLAKYFEPTDVNTLDNGTQVFVPWAQWFVFGPQQLLKQTKGKWRATALPAWQAGGARGGVMGGSSFVIPAKAKNPQLAWLLYEHLTFSKTGYTAVYGPNDVYPGGINTSVPSYLPALSGEALFKPVAELGGQDLWKVATDAAKQVPGGYTIPVWWGKAVDYLGVNLQRMLNGQMSPDDVLSTSAQQIQKNLVDRP